MPVEIAARYRILLIKQGIEYFLSTFLKYLIVKWLSIYPKTIRQKQASFSSLGARHWNQERIRLAVFPSCYIYLCNI